jgi:hypothetical protein
MNKKPLHFRPAAFCPAVRSLAVSGLMALSTAASCLASDDVVPWPAPAPQVRLATVAGEQTVALGDYRGRYVVLHFGTSW